MSRDPSRDSSAVLLSRWKDDGDQDAATELYRRYIRRLIGLARGRLSPRLARRVEPDEVADSVARTFFCRVRDGRQEVLSGTDLWSLLARITVNKVVELVEFHTAGKRSIEAEESAGGSARVTPAEGISREPDVAEVLALEDERDALLDGMLPAHREIVRLRLEGLDTREISRRVALGERMVNLVLARFAEKARRRLAD